MPTGRKRGSKSPRKFAQWRTRGEVYFIQGEMTGLIKIGFAEDARRRLQITQCTSPDRLALLGRILSDTPALLERELHVRFGALRAHGEWFRPGDDLLAFIAERGQAYAAETEQELRAALDAA